MASVQSKADGDGRSSAHCLCAQFLCVHFSHALWIPQYNEFWPDLGPATFLSPPDPGGVTCLGLTSEYVSWAQPTRLAFCSNALSFHLKHQQVIAR